MTKVARPPPPIARPRPPKPLPRTSSTWPGSSGALGSNDMYQTVSQNLIVLTPNRELPCRSVVLRSMKPLLVLIAVLLTACGTTQGPQSHGGPVQDQVSLIDTLRGKSVTVDITGTMSQPFLKAQSGTAVRISGGSLTTAADLQLFEYGSASAASADAQKISPD